ncbi:restriction endonuclease subunit R [Pantanalinema rosaneae CENA516]|uniref:restriction endonuclease subunit R n=1 Tax=Pantanalinema rosaneae TaxID=1620701 RepID=UPI003D6E0248
MVQTIQASELSLHEVEARFGLQEANEPSFFPEFWQNLPELTEPEQRSLDEIKANFLYLKKYPMSEEAVKLVIVSPLLAMSGFYRPPFHLRTEAPIQIALEADDAIVRGRIDVLVLQDQFWVMVVESKEAGFSVNAGIAQTIAYLAATPHPDRPAFGLITNGTEFLFAKLVKSTNQYGFADLFTLQRRHNDLYNVASILQQLRQTIAR